MDGTVCAKCTVIAQDPDGGGIVVAFDSGQITSLPVKMMYQGYADPLRIRQQPLPQRGTRGAVIFPNGDIRNGLWLGAYYPNLQDAITSDPGDPSVDYHAHWSGFWSLLNASGTTAFQWPDGSYVVAGSGTTLPTLYRHIVDENQKRQRQEYKFSDRVPNPPAPFAFTFVQASGNGVGGTTGAIDASGNVKITGGQGASLTVSFASGSLTIDASGNIGLNVPSGKNLDITDGGAASDGLALVSALLSWLNNHNHTLVQPGTGTSGPPTSPATAQQIESAIIKIQQ